MATFLSSALALALVVQAAPPGAVADSGGGDPHARLARDSSDGGAWLGLARGYLARVAAYHRHDGAGEFDSVGARALLDSSELALGRAERVLGGAPAGDSARALRVAARGARALLAWEGGGADAAAAVWSSASGDVRLPAVLEELGENLLRACPRGGLLLTAGPVESDAAWYMHFGRGLRRDLVVVPLDVWRADTVFRRRVTDDLRVPAPPARGGGEFPWLHRLVDRQPVCASMGFERPPAIRRGLDWKTRPLLWVAGPRSDRDPVPARDFVFAALRLAVDQGEASLPPVLALYRRAARASRGLCEPLRVYGLREEVGCR